MIRSVKQSDADVIVEIYNHYVANTVVTFEDKAVSSAEMQDRITETLSADLPWFVAEQAGSVIGYAFASKWKGRCAYRFAVEVTVYLSPSSVAKGVGSGLYEVLLTHLRGNSIHVAMGGHCVAESSQHCLTRKIRDEEGCTLRRGGF